MIVVVSLIVLIIAKGTLVPTIFTIACIPTSPLNDLCLFWGLHVTLGGTVS